VLILVVGTLIILTGLILIGFVLAPSEGQSEEDTWIFRL
jgi:hypothetical protein